MFNVLKLAQVLNSKLCHELSGFIGSINTGAELINSQDTVIRDKAAQILKTIPNELHNLVNFYRTVYGFSTDSDIISFYEIKTLCNNAVPKRVKFEFIPKHVAEININVGKLIMCLVISSSKNILKEGNIKVDVKEQGNSITVDVYGDYLKEKINKVFVDKDQEENFDIDIYNVHEHYTSYLCKILGFEISSSKSERHIQYNAFLSQ